MMSSDRSTEVLIIGGGVIGLATARELALGGVARVTVIERGEFGAEASWAAGGMLAPQSEADEPDDFFRLTVAARELYPEFARSLEEESGIDTGFDTAGTIYTAFTAEDQQRLEDRFRWQSAAGLSVQQISGRDARAPDQERLLNACRREATRLLLR